MKRALTEHIINDLSKKMVFLGGPRQVGKTTLAKSLKADTYPDLIYFNWDVSVDKEAILAQKWPQKTPLVIFDELHKYPKWKQWIKGLYDSRPDSQQYLVTGSARLDVFKRGGDSLLGRYHYWRLHPLTLDELPHGMSADEGYRRLLAFGGFPEPFLEADERIARRWRRERFDRVLKEDIRDLENIKNIQLLQLFALALRARIGSLVTLSNIARDLEISPKTAKTWLTLLENVYLGFAIYPYTQNIPRSILKPAKFYFYDNADVEEDKLGEKVENLVATHLIKKLHFLEDYHGYRCSLHYIRDKEGREVDFAVVVEGKLEYLIEVKLSEDKISPHLTYYKDKLQPKHCVQLVSELSRAYTQDGIEVMSPTEFFTDEYLS